jgi:hypothetical protein
MVSIDVIGHIEELPLQLSTISSIEDM